MATGNRTLKLSILADVDELKKSLGDANNSVESSASKIADFGKKAALAFAAVGAAATAFAVQAVKNAAEDEAAQRKLEETIRASTQATEAQTKAVGDYIDATSIAVGITDDELRPAFSRLVRSTNDVQQAQKLLNLALDITAATGKPLEAVTNALGKAYDGNLTSLSRLGLGIDQSILKTKDFDLVYNNLAGTFGNFAENEAKTTEAQFRRIQIAIDEAKESVGAALLPAVNQLTAFLLASAVPALNQFIAGLTGSGLAADQAETSAFRFGEQIKSTIEFVISMKNELIILGQIIATVFVASKVAAFITQIQVLTGAMVALNVASTTAAASTAAASAGAALKLGLPVVAAGAVALAAVGNQAFTPTLPGGAVSTRGAPGQSIINNITVQSVDAEGSARAVAKVINQSSSRSVPQLYNSGITRAR